MVGRNGNFGTMKRWLIGVSGVCMAVASVILSKMGVGISGDLAWIGTVVAVSLFCAELMFNSNFDELNWTILALGLGAYIYSIWTNVQGFYFYRGIEGTLFTHFDVTSFFGGVFMDIYPELAIAWAVGESKIGDLIGNLVKTSNDPSKLTTKNSTAHNSTNYNKNDSGSNQSQAKRVDRTQRQRELEQQYRKPQSQPQPQNMTFDPPTQAARRVEPNYHPMNKMTQMRPQVERDMDEEDMPEFLRGSRA